MDNRNHHRMPRENANLVHKSKFFLKKYLRKVGIDVKMIIKSMATGGHKNKNGRHKMESTGKLIWAAAAAVKITMDEIGLSQSH